MNPDAAAATPAPLHDIAGPVAFFPYPVWMVVLAALGVLAVVLALVWFFFLQKRPDRIESARMRARRWLDGLRGRVATTEVYDFSIEVSEVLRRFIEETRGVRMTRQTSMEFLRAIQGRNDFTEDERGILEQFLEKADLIKFARVHATDEDSRALLEIADGFVAETGKGRLS